LPGGVRAHFGSRRYTYDANNRITQGGGGSPAEYRYDGEGNRVMKVAGGKTGIRACRRGVRRDRGVSKTPPRPAGDGLGSPSSDLFGGSEKLVEYRYANSTRFFHNDHLGTTKAVTDHTGLVLERWDHYPFGEEWVSGLSGDRYRYTGHLRDQETGNDYAGEPLRGAFFHLGSSELELDSRGHTLGTIPPGRWVRVSRFERRATSANPRGTGVAGGARGGDRTRTGLSAHRILRAIVWFRNSLEHKENPRRD
jgi:hypothetical protein